MSMRYIDGGLIATSLSGYVKAYADGERVHHAKAASR